VNRITVFIVTALFASLCQAQSPSPMDRGYNPSKNPYGGDSNLYNPSVAQGHGMHKNKSGSWVNEKEGNIYGDSRFNLDADPRFNLNADPRFNSKNDPRFNLSADPRFNPKADPRFSTYGDPAYSHRQKKYP
jgi:hypothetical protein